MNGNKVKSTKRGDKELNTRNKMANSAKGRGGEREEEIDIESAREGERAREREIRRARARER